MTARLITAGCLLALAVAAAAGAAAQTGGTAAISDGVVKIGLILDMSGPYSDATGVGSATAASMAVEDFGGKVLGAPVEVVVADHRDNVDRAAAIARQWFGSDHVDAIMDVAGSSEALLVQAVATTRDRIVMLSAPGAERLTNEACSPVAVHYAFDTYAVAHTVAPAVLQRGGNSWFFVTVDYSFGYDLENEFTAVIKAGGGQVLGATRHPFGAADFSSYLAQARQSGATVIALANAGNDMVAALTRAGAIGMIPGPQIFVPLALRFTSVNRIGLPITQNMPVAEPFYWDYDDRTRTWSRRFLSRVGTMPNSLQAGVYSAVTHYLKAVATAGTDATAPVMQAMRAAPVDDFFAHNGRIRADGVMVHDMHLFQVKEPGQSRDRWDDYRLVETVPGDKAFRPVEQSQCRLVRP